MLARVIADFGAALNVGVTEFAGRVSRRKTTSVEKKLSHCWRKRVWQPSATVS
jgi:hypothetical protein